MFRFSFGKNWVSYSKNIGTIHIKNSEKDLKKFLKKNIKNKKFLDIGCGSGLSSLSARNLGATVTSYDRDYFSTKCTRELKKKYYKDNKKWKILNSGDVLNSNFCKKLGKFDIIYSWGVLHHTGKQKQALQNIFYNSKKGSIFFIALYNDQGRNSKIWKIIKYTYNLLKFWPLQIIFALIILIANILVVHVFTFHNVSLQLVRYKNNPKKLMTKQFAALKIFIGYIKNYKKSRGMSYWHDQLDWIGGYPYEVSKPKDIIKFFKKKKCRLIKIKTNEGYGNNIYLFKKN